MTTPLRTLHRRYVRVRNTYEVYRITFISYRPVGLRSKIVPKNTKGLDKIITFDNTSLSTLNTRSDLFYNNLLES